MNVNDVICVGAEPIAMLDFIALPRGRTRRSASAIGVGLRAGPSSPGSRSPAARSPRSATWSAASTSPAPAIGTVALDAIVDGSAVAARATRDRPALLRPPLQRLHARPPRAARRAPARRRPARPTARRGPARADRDLRQADASSCCAPRSTSAASPTSPGGVDNLLRLAAEVGYEIDAPLAGPADLRPDRGARRHRRRGDARRLQHGLRLSAWSFRRRTRRRL